MGRRIASVYELTKEERKIAGGDRFVVFYAEGTKAKTFKTKAQAQKFSRSVDG
jgi:hypothetical protein